MTEMYVAAGYIAWSDDVHGHVLETPEIDTDYLGLYDPADNVIVISAAAVNLAATYGDYPDDYTFRGDFGEKDDYNNYRLDWLYSWFRKLFIVTTNHELLHAVIGEALPWTMTEAECELRDKQEEWIINRMGWT